MAAIVHFQCRHCEREVAISPERALSVRCPSCNTDVRLFINDSILSRRIVTACVSCGHDALYVQKDFNRRFGMGIVVLGIIVSIYFFARNLPMLAMAALGLTALIDFVLYLVVREVTVCYSCHAVYRGFDRNPEHEPFDLKRLEKYGGRAPR